MWRRLGSSSAIRLLKRRSDGDLSFDRECRHVAAAGFRSCAGGWKDRDNESDRDEPEDACLPILSTPVSSFSRDSADSRVGLDCSWRGSSLSRGYGAWGSTALVHGAKLGKTHYWGTGNVRFASTGAVGGDGFAYREEESATDVAGIADAVRDLAVNTDIATTRVVGEVAAAAADSALPSAALQYLIEAVHLQAGLPWWAAIAAVTVVVRTLVFPITVYQIKATAKLTLLRPELERLTNIIKASNYDAKVVDENQKRLHDLLKKNKTSPFSPVIGAFVQAPLFMCFFFAIRNMAEKVESFKEGGFLCFTDLSTPDPFYILPILSGLLFLITVEIGAAEGMQGQPILGKMKMFMRGLAVVTVPLTATFPKALFCYWLTSNVCSMVQSSVLKNPQLKKALDIPETNHLDPLAPVVTYSQPPKHAKGSVSSKSSGKR